MSHNLQVQFNLEKSSRFGFFSEPAKLNFLPKSYQQESWHYFALP
jgi:hypothetical protein